MNKQTCLVFAAITSGMLLANTALAQEPQNQSYKVPPSHYGSYGRVISDEEMQKCVELYNQILWMRDELKKINVNHYSEDSVNAYNAKAQQGNELVKKFNAQCADRSSESACKEANKLNREKGLPEVDCSVRN